MLSPNMPGVNGHQALPQASHGANGHQALHQASSPVNSPVKNLVHNSPLDVHLSNSFDDLLQERLPKLSKQLSNNSLKLANNEEEISILKDENTNIRFKVEGLLGEVKELTQRVNNQDKLIKNNSMQLSDVSESIDNFNKSDHSDKYSDVTLAAAHTYNAHKATPQPTPTRSAQNPSQVAPAHLVLPPPNPPTPRSANYSQVASAYLGPPTKSLHVQPPSQATPVSDNNMEQLKIDMKKAKRTIGISPIKKDDLQFWMDTDLKQTKDDELYYDDNYNEVRKKAAIDYLSNWLLIKEQDIHILNTRMAKDHTTGILWLTMEEREVVKIFQKAGRVRNSKVKLHTFYPHQVWERKNTLQNLCFLEKQKNHNFKFMIKPGISDLELYTKQKGEHLWVKTNLKAYGNIPEIQFKSSQKEPMVPKLRQSESAKMKRKAGTPNKVPAKKTKEYTSPNHAFDNEDLDQTEDVTTNVEDSENLANELAEAVKVSNNGD